MSYRGRKPPHQGQRGRGEADGVLPSMVAPTVDVSMVATAAVSGGAAVNSLGFSIPILSSRQVEMKEGLDNITSRLNRALSKYDSVFKDDENESADFEGTDSIRTETEYTVTNVEDERRQFQTRYETITARVDAMELERTELLNSMAEWLDSDQPSNDSSKDTPQSDGTSTEHSSAQSLRDEVLNTKMDFKKLEKMNNEKDRLVSQGQATELIQEESTKLQMKVVQKFKKMYESKKLAAARRTFGDHWKHASDEIVVLLRRIRSEGTGSIDALEEQLEKAANAIQRQAEEMIRLEGRIREKEQMVEKWSQENAKLTNDNLLLNSEKEKCRDIIKKLKKALIEERRKKGTATPEDVKNIADAKTIPRKMQVVPRQDANQRRNRKVQGSERDGMLCQVCRRELDRGTVEPDPSSPGDSQADESTLVPVLDDEHGIFLPSSDVIVLEEENEWLTSMVSRLEQTLVEKEMQMMKLELQLSELMDAVKNSSPQIIKRLSMIDPVDFQNLRSARDVILKTPAGKTEHKLPTRDTTSFNQTTNASRNAKNLLVPRGQKTSSKKGAKKRTASDIVKEAALASLPSQPGLGDNEEISRLTEQRDQLQADLTTMKGQLMRAQRDLISVKYASTVPGTMGPGSSDSSVKGFENQTGHASSSSLSQTSTIPETVSKPRKQTVVKYDDEFQAYAELMQANKDTRPSQTLSRPRRNSKGGNERSQPDQVVAEVGAQKRDGAGSSSSVFAENEHVQMEEFVTFDQGMQTDSSMDPLGQWSNVPSLKKRRKSSQLPSLVSGTTPADADTPEDKAAPDVKPPTEWTQFDPTGSYTPAMDSKRASISHQMRTGQLPTKLDADGIVSYVERELGRIVQGITGYTGYLKRLIQREVTDMMNTNIAIRKQLSETSLRKLDQGGLSESIPSPADTGRRSRGLATPIRRGRFEIMKDKNQSSRFAAKNAFATIQPGGRRFMHGTSPEQQWNFQAKTPTPVFADQVGLWNTFARDHIMAADEAAMERLLPSLNDSLSTRLQKQIEMIGQHSIDVLRGTTVFFRETVTQQMEEYSILHNTFGIRQEVKVLMTPTPTPTNTLEASQQVEDPEAEKDKQKSNNKPLPLKLTRSTSHNSFLEHCNVNYSQSQKKQIHVYIDHDFPTQAIDLHAPKATKSLSSIQSSHRYLPPLTGYENQKPRNRDEMHIPKATLPRRGLVTLQVTEAATRMGQLSKAVDSKRRCRPIAVSHRGLQSHQRELLGRLGRKPDGDDNQEAGQPLTTILEFKRQLFQPQEEQSPKSSDHTKVLPPTELDAEPGKILPPLENERRRVIIQAQDQLRGPMQVRDKYVGFLSDGLSTE